MGRPPIVDPQNKGLKNCNLKCYLSHTTSEERKRGQPPYTRTTSLYKDNLPIQGQPPYTRTTSLYKDNLPIQGQHGWSQDPLYTYEYQH